MTWIPDPPAPPPVPPAPPTPPAASRWSFDATTALLFAAAAGGAVALSLGAYGRLHDPSGGTIATFGFSTLISMKVYLGTAAFVLALVQLTSALAMWGRLPGVRGPAPAWLGPVHRWTGTAAFLASLPVAYHCLWSLGFQDTDTRVLAHSLAGCAFYGAFTTKLLALRVEGRPAWTLPLVGGLLVTGLTVIWLTSSLWFFDNFGFPDA
ncbi:MAG TPA: DUF6529 family protein [Acidimicrobiales bacterium]